MKVRVAAALLLALVACREPQPLPPERAEYAGTWEGDGVRLQITPEGGVTYDRKVGAGNEHVEGNIAGWKGDGFVVGAMTVKTAFEIPTPPEKVNGTWTMTVNGMTVYRLSP
ncbi:MAG: hypothetical protein AAGA54_31045 [Myxococcota bacterium]